MQVELVRIGSLCFSSSFDLWDQMPPMGVRLRSQKCAVFGLSHLGCSPRDHQRACGLTRICMHSLRHVKQVRAQASSMNLLPATETSEAVAGMTEVLSEKTIGRCGGYDLAL